MEFHELSSYPEKMLEEITEFLKQQPVKKGVHAGRDPGRPQGLHVHSGASGKGRGHFRRESPASHSPTCRGMYLYMATPVSDLGQKAIEGLEPFTSCKAGNCERWERINWR